MDTVKVSWSGGKDITAAALLHLRAGHKVHMVCFIPFLSEGIPAIRKGHYEHIMSCKERFYSACFYIMFHMEHSPMKYAGFTFSTTP